MTKFSKSIVVASDRNTAKGLTALAAQLSEFITVIAIDDKDAAVNADEAYYIDTRKQSCLAAAEQVKKIAIESGAKLILVELTKNGRYIAATTAAALNTSAYTDACDVWLEENKIYAKRLVYGGEAYKTVSFEGEAVICPVHGIASAESESTCDNITAIVASMPDGVEYVSSVTKKTQKVNLMSAKRIVGVGRGAKSAENIEAVERFAEKIGAELGCTRPVAEDEAFMPRERYLGVSGVTAKPELYIAAGISGQIQHLVGVNESKLIIAINKDKQAPIFEHCDIGIVADMMEVISALSERL